MYLRKQLLLTSWPCSEMNSPTFVCGHMSDSTGIRGGLCQMNLNCNCENTLLQLLSEAFWGFPNQWRWNRWGTLTLTYFSCKRSTGVWPQTVCLHPLLFSSSSIYYYNERKSSAKWINVLIFKYEAKIRSHGRTLIVLILKVFFTERRCQQREDDVERGTTAISELVAVRSLWTRLWLDLGRNVLLNKHSVLQKRDN